MSSIFKTRGLTIVDVLATLVALTLLLAIAIPTLGRGRDDSIVVVSLSNLQQINAGLAEYAADFNDRQSSAIVDNFSTFGSDGPSAIVNVYLTIHKPHPPVRLGLGESSPGGPVGSWAYWMPGTPGIGASPANYIAAVPMEFVGTSHFGHFRMINARLLHWYVGLKFYDDVFFAPNDWWSRRVAPWFQNPWEYVPNILGPNTQPIWSSYCYSPAGMFDPVVMRAPSAGGFTDPYSYATGFRSPTLSQALHPALKTRLIEHQWNQNKPDNHCITNLPGPCAPWFFNHGAASEPATLFFDGSTGLLPNTDVIADDAQLISQTGEGLWHRATPLGPTGYRGEWSFDGTIVSHHILTIDGIRGRDTLGTEGTAQ